MTKTEYIEQIEKLNARLAEDNLKLRQDLAIHFHNFDRLLKICEEQTETQRNNFDYLEKLMKDKSNENLKR